MPGWSNTITRSSPSSALTSVDLPTFGRPTTAMRGCSALGFGPRSRVRGKSASTRSIRSLTFSPCAAEIGQRLAQAQLVKLRCRALRAHAFGLVHDQLHAAAGLAQLVRDAAVLRREPARPSTMNSTASASSTACRVWRAIS